MTNKVIILSLTCVGFFDNKEIFKDTLIRDALSFGDISVSTRLNLIKSCVVLNGFHIQGFNCRGKSEAFKIDNENRMDLIKLFLLNTNLPEHLNKMVFI